MERTGGFSGVAERVAEGEAAFRWDEDLARVMLRTADVRGGRVGFGCVGVVVCEVHDVGGGDYGGGYVVEDGEGCRGGYEVAAVGCWGVVGADLVDEEVDHAGGAELALGVNKETVCVGCRGAVDARIERPVDKAGDDLSEGGCEADGGVQVA